MTKLPIAAIYARFSCDKQSPCSIDDQVRRCREIAAAHGLRVDDSLIFVDSAVSGQAHAKDKRQGYKALLEAWDEGRFDVVLVDELERLNRDEVESALLRRRLSANKRVRLISADGTDTANAGWELAWGLKGVLAQEEVRKFSHRVPRGMVGQLERGYMIATPPFGYDLRREFDANDNRIGTKWVINEKEAATVRDIFKRREDGESMHQIAKWLNETNVPITREARSEDGGYWRPSRVKNLLTNRIYMGKFVWHGSVTYQNRAKKKGEEVKETVYERPELALVSAETWNRCNAKRGSRSGYGGGKHALAGLITCGHCGGTLVLNSNSRCRSVYCANCTVAKSALGAQERQTVTVAVCGVELMLTEALHHFLTSAFVAAFRESLHDKLVGNSRREFEACEAEFRRLDKACMRYATMLGEADEYDHRIATLYKEHQRQAKAVEERLKELAAGYASVDRNAVKAQLKANPADLLAGLFAADVAPQRMRAILGRLFPAIILTGKRGRYRSVFRVRFAVGAALAMVTNTATVIDESVELTFEVRYKPDFRSGLQEHWSVQVVDADELGKAA